MNKLLNEYGEYNLLKNPVKFLSEAELFQKFDLLNDAKNELEDYVAKTPTALGIAAPQFGIDLPIFVIKKMNGEINHCINPFFEIKIGDESTKGTEGCLSLPDIFCIVERHNAIKVKYWRFNFKNEIKFFSTNLDRSNSARYQHELDHLNGVLIIDKGIEVNHPASLPNAKMVYKVKYADGFDFYIDGENILLYHNEPTYPELHSSDAVIIGYKLSD